MKGVAFHEKGFTSIIEMLPGFGFHTLCMGLGVYLLDKGRVKKPAAENAADK